MKRILLSVTLATVLFSSCSTAFKAGQTPDDLYYSPGREIAAAKEEKARVADGDVYDEYVSSSDDRYLHMKVANRERWSSIDNYDYWNDSRYDFTNYGYNNYASMYGSPYGGFSGMGFYSSYYSLSYLSMFNPYYLGPGWNLGLGYYGLGYGYGLGGYHNYYGWSSPLYTLISYSTPKIAGPLPASSSITAYKNKATNNSNWGYTDARTGTFVPMSGSQAGYSAITKRVVSNSTSSNSYDRPVRSFTPSTSSVPVSVGSSAGGSSGGFKSSGTTASSGRGGRN